MMERTSKKNLLRNVVLGLLALSCSSALAAEQNLQSYNLDPMSVTATRYETRDIDIPASTEVFTQEKIEKLGANNVMDVVSAIPGFTLTASPTGNTYIGFRGMAKDNVAILVNGIMLNQDGNYDLETISTDIIDRIEVVKGGSAVLYGSSASAGVINIITKKSGGQNKILLGAGDKHKFKGSVNINADKLQVSYNHFQAKDRGKVYKSTRYDYLGDKVEKDSVNVQYNLNDHLQFQYLHSDKESDCSKTTTGGFHSVLKYNFGQVHYTNNDLLATLYIRDRNWKFNTSVQEGTNIGLDVQNKWELGETLLTAGVVYENEDTQNNETIKAAKRDSGAVFFMTENKLSEATTLFVGARESYVEESGSEFCPQVQIMQKLGEDNNLYLNINRSMRAPNVNEQWGTGSQMMNPDLKAETGWNYELGWKKKLSDVELFKINVFKMDVKDRIYRDHDDAADKDIFRNANKYRNTGVEVGYENALSGKFGYNIGLSYANPEQKAKGGDWQRADFRLGINAGLGYYVGNTVANISLNYMGERIGDCDDMVNINMNVSHKLNNHSKVKFAVYNLLNRDDIRTGNSSGRSGSIVEERNWLLSYEHTF